MSSNDMAVKYYEECIRLRQRVAELELENKAFKEDNDELNNEIATAGDANDSLLYTIGQLRQRVAELEAELEPCRVYMKEGESIVECLDRNRSDALRMTVKWNKRGERMKQLLRWGSGYGGGQANLIKARRDWFKDGEPL